MLQAQELTVVSGAATLHCPALTIRPGEVLGLVGPSGSGKSLLLGGLAGAGPSVRGEVRLGGRVLSARQRRDRRRIAYLHERTLVRPADLTLDQLLRASARLLGADAGNAAELRALLGLERHARERLSDLPSGVLERVDLALAELPAPQLVLLDHPLAHLDETGLQLLDRWLDRLRARRAMVFWTVCGLPARGRRDGDVVIADGRLGPRTPASDSGGLEGAS